MNGRMFPRLLLGLALLQPLSASAQGFAGLGSEAQGFAIPQRGVSLSFPKDHRAHPEYRIEWWYVTANLMTEDGRSLGAQWTLFRSALAPTDSRGWSSSQIWIGHAAVTTSEKHFVAERLGRGGVGQAGVETAPFNAWIDDWQMKAGPERSGDALDHLTLKANGMGFSYQLQLSANGPLALQGDRGFSVKSLAGQASYYYSQPFYQVTGSVEMDGRPMKVRGRAWLDREWSSQPLAADQSGWDWFSLHLASGDKVMAFQLRDSKGGYTSANWISADGKTTPLASDEVVLEPLRSADVNGRSIPIAWRVRVPGKGLDVTTRPINEQSWMATSTPYWEGPIFFEGSSAGVGYLEMTGY